MNLLSVGDMAQYYTMQKHNSALKTRLSQLGSEVTTGKVSDVGATLGGDFSQISAINRSLSMLESFSLVSTEAGIAASAMQSSLETIQTLSQEIGPKLMSITTIGGANVLDSITADADERLQSMVSALNTNVAGRYLFSGAATDSAALINSSDLMMQVSAAASGIMDSANIIAAVEAYFDAPAGSGGYLDNAYLGDTTPRGSFQIADGESVQMTLTAGAEELRTALKGLALASFSSNDAIGLNEDDRLELAQASGAFLVEASEGITVLRSELGTVEGLIESSYTRNNAEASALEIARSQLISADPYDTAAALEATQTQLEILYALTSRMSGLTLANYL